MAQPSGGLSPATLASVFTNPAAPVSLTIWKSDQSGGTAAASPRIVLVLPGQWRFAAVARTFSFVQSLHIPKEITQQMQAEPGAFSMVVGFQPDRSARLPPNTFHVIGGQLGMAAD